MNERLRWAPLVLGTMLGCIVLAVVHLIQMVVRLVGSLDGWYAAYFICACVVAMLEAYYGRWLLRDWDRGRGPASVASVRTDAMDRWKLVVLEIVVLLILLKIGSYAGESMPEVWADVRSWVREPSLILDGETLVALILALLCWAAFTQTLVAFEQLDDPLAFWANAQGERGESVTPQARLGAYYMGGGVILLITTGLTWLGRVASLGWTGIGAFWSAVTSRSSQSTSLPAWQVVDVLVYYVLGLVMLGQVHYAALRQDWQARKTPVEDRIEAKWWRSSLIFVGLTAVVALLLPTGYTAAVLDVLRFGLAVVLRALYVAAAALLFVVSLPFWYLARLLIGDQIAAPQAPSVAAIQPPAQPPPGSGPAWLGIVRIAFFWLMVLGLLVYLLRIFWREHPEVRQALASFRPIRWLLRLWRAWLARLSSWGVVERLRRRRDGTRAGEDGRSAGQARLAQRAPDSNRGRVLYYYLDVVRRARRAGVPRRPAQTPFAYGVTLKDNLPETSQQVDALTEAFVEARYSRHRIESGLVQRVRASWQQIKRFLGGKREDRD